MVSWSHGPQVQQVQATRAAFAAILEGGRVVAWGDPEYGGDCSAVRGQLRNPGAEDDVAFPMGNPPKDRGIYRKYELLTIWRIYREYSLLGESIENINGYVSTFHGPPVATPRNVEQLQTSFGAFAAILADGSVVTWGDPESGGDSTAVQTRLKNVRKIHAPKDGGAFAAILADGSVVAGQRLRLFNLCGNSMGLLIDHV